MRPLTLSAIFAAIISLSSIIGSVVVVDERYAHASDVRSLRYEFQATTLEGKLDRLQDRRFKLEDRLRQNPRDDMDNATIQSNISILAPGVVMLLKALIWLVGLLGSALLAVLIWLAKSLISKVNGMDRKLDGLHEVMLECDGCRHTIQARNRRAGDLDINDGCDL